MVKRPGYAADHSSQLIPRLRMGGVLPPIPMSLPLLVLHYPIKAHRLLHVPQAIYV